MREFIESDDLASEILMIRALDVRAVLIVEGDSDARFFERFVDHEACYVLSAHDRHKAIFLLRTLNSRSIAGVVAIVDADFGRISQTLESDRNLFFTDGHDLEMMLLQSQATDRVVAEHASHEKATRFLAQCRPKVIATVLAQSCLPLGLLLLISLRGNCGLTFEDLAFKDFVDRDSLAIDVKKMIKTVMDKSSRHDAILAKTFHDEIIEKLSTTTEIWDVSRGHDCTQLLCFALQYAWGTKKSKTSDRRAAKTDVEGIERELRLSFNEHDLAGTTLYSSILAWEAGNVDYRILLRAA